jgi:hypothetical protein
MALSRFSYKETCKMRTMSTHGLMMVSVAVIVALVVGLPTAAAQKKESTAKSEDAKPAAQRREAKKPVADEPAPRMPAHFNKVITEEQRPKLIAILKDHAPKIQQLRAELASLVEKRDEALLKVLTPTQRRQLEELRAEASAKRAAASADATGADQSEPKKSS